MDGYVRFLIDKAIYRIPFPLQNRMKLVIGNLQTASLVLLQFRKGPCFSSFQWKPK